MFGLFKKTISADILINDLASKLPLKTEIEINKLLGIDYTMSPEYKEEVMCLLYSLTYETIQRSKISDADKTKLTEKYTKKYYDTYATFIFNMAGDSLDNGRIAVMEEILNKGSNEYGSIFNETDNTSSIVECFFGKFYFQYLDYNARFSDLHSFVTWYLIKITKYINDVNAKCKFSFH